MSSMSIRFCGPVTAVLATLLPCGLAGQAVTVERIIEVGRAPHGVAFAGDTAFVALSGDDAIAVVDLASGRVLERRAAAGTPLDVLRLPDGRLLHTRFSGSELAGPGGATWEVGASPSLFAPRQPHGRAFVSSERADVVTAFDLRAGRILRTWPTGVRPYPPALTSDGALAFVPNRTDGTVTVIDALNDSVLATVPACAQPEGGAVTVDDAWYVVACGGDGALAWINAASFEVVHRLTDGLGVRPFSIAMTRDGRVGLVNNAGDSTVSVVDLSSRRVIGSVVTGRQPIVVRMHPDGRRAVVSNELSGTLTVLSLAAPSPPVDFRPNRVLVLGMIHGSHRTSERYGLDVLRAMIRAADPDYVLTEIPPSRLEAAQREFDTTGAITESRVRVFPEYVDVLFPLTRELTFTIVPTAGWNPWMNEYRNRALRRLPDERPADWATYQAAAERRDSVLATLGAPDDPRMLHSDAYDEANEIAYGPYAELFNDDLGPGGWANINRAHWAHMERFLDTHRGEGLRVLITYGAGHKGWILRELRRRDDVELIDPATVIR